MEQMWAEPGALGKRGCNHGDEALPLSMPFTICRLLYSKWLHARSISVNRMVLYICICAYKEFRPQKGDPLAFLPNVRVKARP